jgi:hypothetical protein
MAGTACWWCLNTGFEFPTNIALRERMPFSAPRRLERPHGLVEVGGKRMRNGDTCSILAFHQLLWGQKGKDYSLDEEFRESAFTYINKCRYAIVRLLADDAQRPISLRGQPAQLTPLSFLIIGIQFFEPA